MKAVIPKPGQIYVCRSKTTRTRSRRIVAVLNKVTVVYSDGAEQLRHCKLRAFRRWAAQYGAVATRVRRPRTLVLR